MTTMELTKTSMHDLSAGTFVPMLRSLLQIFDKAIAQAAEKKIDLAALPEARLAPDMYPLTRQVQIACDQHRHRLLLVRRSQIDPVGSRGQPGVQIVHGPQPVLERRGPNLAHERRWIGVLVAVHRVLGGSRGRGELPGVLLGAGSVGHGHLAPARSDIHDYHQLDRGGRGRGFVDPRPPGTDT